MYYTEKQNIPGLLMLVDFEKPFDICLMEFSLFHSEIFWVWAKYFKLGTDI